MSMSGVRMLASSPMLMFLLSLLIASFFDTTAGQIGVCYGRVGDNLPSPREVVAMYKENNIKRMRIYDPNHEVLDALRGSQIELILDLPSPDVRRMGEQPAEATKWVQDNVQKYYNDVRFRYISVGNELTPEYLAGNDGILIQAMENIDKALSDAGLNIKVSTTTFMGAFTETYPPSNGRFKSTYLKFLEPAIRFLAGKQSPLLVNIYTYFGYMEDPRITLEYALFKPSVNEFNDHKNNLHYSNLFEANLDSVYAALEKSGGGSLDVVVSESGWPTDKGKETNVANAETYVKNLMQHVKNGSPKRRGKAIETYIFAMFNENLKGTKPEDQYEEYWGLFFPNKTPQLRNVRFE